MAKIYKKSELLREGYLKGLREARRIIAEAIGSDQEELNQQLRVAVRDKPDVAKVKQLLAAGADANTLYQPGNWDIPVLSLTNNVEIAKALLNAEPPADVNAVDRMGKSTALMQACRVCNVELAKVLIEAGADVYMEDIYHRNAAMIACLCENDSVIDLLKMLKAEGLDLHQTTTRGENLLMFQCSCPDPNPKVVQFLIKEGIDPNDTDDKGHTAMQFATGDEFLRSGSIFDANKKQYCTTLKQVVNVLKKAGATH